MHNMLLLSKNKKKKRAPENIFLVISAYHVYAKVEIIEASNCCANNGTARLTIHTRVFALLLRRTLQVQLHKGRALEGVPLVLNVALRDTGLLRKTPTDLH